MIKKVNKNKFGVIEYSITNEEDLKDLPKGDTDNSVYAVDDSNKVYLYSKKANDYILINGGGTDSSNGFFVKRIDMGNPETEVDSKLFDGDGYYSVTGTIYGNMLLDSIVHLKEVEEQVILTLYENCKHVFGYSKNDGKIGYIQEALFESLEPIGNLMDFIGDKMDLPSALQDKTLVEIIKILYSSSAPS